MRRRTLTTSVAVLAALIVALCIAPAQAHAAWDEVQTSPMPYVKWELDSHLALTQVEKKCTSYSLLWDRTESNAPQGGADKFSLFDGWTFKDHQLVNWFVADRDQTFGERCIVQGDVYLIIKDGVTITCNDGIWVPSGSSLTIYSQGAGTGRLVAKADYDYQAAIGGNSGQSGGNITVHGGIVEADCYEHGASAAGIGGGWNGNGGDFTIYDGMVTAKGANVSYDGGAGIGGGDGGNGGNVRIYGGTVNATGGCDGAGIGGGDDGAGGTIEIWGGDVTATGTAGAGLGGGEYGAAGTITIYAGTVRATGGDYGAGIGGGRNCAGGEITVHGGEVTAAGGKYGAGIGGGEYGNGGIINIDRTASVTATGGYCGAGIGGGYRKDGGTITISGDTAVVTATGGEYGAGIGGGSGGDNNSDGTSGNITITGGKLITATGGTYAAGIGSGYNSPGDSISISGGDKVIAKGGYEGAGIGGGYEGHSGNINISDGWVEAYGGDYAAGIGGGYYRWWDTITLSGGQVLAKGGSKGAGIGGGDRDESCHMCEGTITIEGTVDVTAIGGANAAGIGGGELMSGGTINIKGGRINTARCGTRENPGQYGAGIGGGYGAPGGTINISGGEIMLAEGGYGGAGIGDGHNAETPGGTISISGGTVKLAQGGQYAAGIGGGYGGEIGSITISDGMLTAKGGEEAAGIGGGRGTNSGTILIEGGSVNTTGGKAGVGIGAGFTGSTVNVTINGGTVESKSGEPNGNYKGAGIGMSGDATFSGAITFNGGDVTTALLGKAFDSLDDSDDGVVSFKGGNVHVYPEGNKAVIAKTISVDNGMHVVYRETGTAKTIHVPSDQWESVLRSVGKELVEVGAGVAPQNVTADNVAVTYGETGKRVSGTSSHGGTISYAVKAGSEDYLKVDASTGELTVLSVPADGKAFVTVTAAAIGEFRETSLDVTVTISKAEPTVTAPTAKELIFNNSEQELVNAGAVTGGTMQYALGTEAVASDEYTASVPKATDAGTYYVWYKVVGDSNHNDVAARLVTVTISKAEPTVTAPTAKTLTYIELYSQELLNRGYATDGTMVYALGTETAATGEYTASVPKATDAGTYYVWYKVVGDPNHSDTEPARVTVTINKHDPYVSTPTAKELIFNGSEQELVDAGIAGGGTMVYALGTETAATGEYTSSVPKATDVGTYYVWYKVVGDPNYNDTEAACLTTRLYVTATVTFKVVDGSWDDGTTADKTVALKSLESHTMKLSAEQIPAVGAKPKERSHKAGSWNVEPSTETAITEDTTFIYTYVEKKIIRATAYFKVVNGSWDDGTTNGISRTLVYYEDNPLILTAGLIPGVGNRPNDGYEAGSWNVTPIPGTEMADGATYTYIYTYAQKEVALRAANVTLSGELVMNYYLSVPDEFADAGAKVVMDGPEGKVEVDLSNATNDIEGRYVASYPLTAIKTNSPITLSVVDAEGNPVELRNSKGERLEGDEKSYGLYDYFADAAASQDLDDDLKAKIMAIYTYCAYAVRWKYPEAGELPEDIDVLPSEEEVIAGVEEHKATKKGTAPAGVKVTGITLLLDSYTSLRLYFTCDDGIASHKVTLDGNEVEPKLLSGNKYYVEVENIGVANLEKRHTVTFDGTYTVELDALSYVSAALAYDKQTDTLKDLVRAFYAYDKAFNAGISG